MLRKILIISVLGVFVLLGAVSCRQNTEEKNADEQTKSVETEEAEGEGSQPDQTTTVTKKERDDLEGGVSVPAKRENLTAADRAAFLRAVGLKEYADGSERFLKAFDFLKNAGMDFFEMDGGKYLVEIIVDPGANQTTAVYAVYQETAPNKAKAKLLELTRYYLQYFGKNNERLDKGEIVKSTGSEIVGSPKFNKDTKILTITAYGRGTGGCGNQSKYKITNDRAELIEARDQRCTNTNVEPENWKKIDLEKAESAGGVRDADFSYMKPEHIAVLKAWLAKREDNLHLARYEYDSSSSQKYLREDAPERDPFYVFGDFNKNGIEDFAVILENEDAKVDPRTKRVPNAMAVFEMSAANKNGKPNAAFFSAQIDSLFIIHPVKNNTLSIGSYPSDDGFYLAPKDNSYAVKAMLKDF